MQGDPYSQQPLVMKGVLLPVHYGRCHTRDKEQQEFIVLLKDENFSMQWDSLEDSLA
jgi:hypothetical protein